MNAHIQSLLDFFASSEKLAPEEKEKLIGIAKALDKDHFLVEFKLERAEKMRRATSILLEETIEELDKKREVVEQLALVSSRQASLERIRAEIASMRNVDDLKEISPLIWEELQNMNVPFIRCGVFLMNLEESNIHILLNTPEQESIAVLDIPFNSTKLTEKVHKAWKKQKIYTENWKEEDFNKWVKTLARKGLIESKELYKSKGTPVNLELHFIPFNQGMLYIGNFEKLSEESLELCQSLASNFSMAYDRYEDFKKLETAKRKVEEAIKNLRTTQDQLVQQEKLASLGQLTAGIAHEIQNPLNFVNNFSELNIELIEEANEELDKGAIEEAKAILKDLAENSDKISHHGTRAGAIVRAMLEHSRKNEGEKAPLDINGLTEEYLKLSYHGLRAKDKTFNSSFELDLDPKLPKVKVVAQDIGRVILNLINNAFDAVNERSKSNEPDYKPQVKVSSQLIQANGHSGLKNSFSGPYVLLTFKDNGFGIPNSIKDKIFQPFFTTKPTGSGTGLGLSLSYDIIKAHGGHIDVNSTERVGSEFTITLPI